MAKSGEPKVPKKLLRKLQQARRQSAALLRTVLKHEKHEEAWARRARLLK